MTEHVKDAAFMAARVYVERNDKGRTLTQCIAWAAQKHGVQWKQVGDYLSGVGARALLDPNNDELTEAAQEVLDNAEFIQRGGSAYSESWYEVHPDVISKLSEAMA